ncbi:MAG: DNA (cytosine-5-)-methyltransferase [Acidaminococcaceae bacterium]|jgi:DNA-methyltransferase (dcm)|nr:DNA (cytosine-5-)-methyltransferase [Acidaminococcaceae bacterium]
MYTINKAKVKEAMDAAGIKTQTQLAQKIGITKNQLSLILSTKYTPLKTKFEEMCKVLEASPEYIIDFDNHLGKNSEPNLFIKPSEITAIELFAGAGGLALGLEQAGIRTLAHVEFNKYCCETLKTNRPKWNVICDDIANVSFKSYENMVDIVTGGFPCQAFSYAGKKLGFEDTRGTLFYQFARCIKETNPLMFMAENVRGLISHDEGRTLKTILSVFTEIGYDVQYKVLNSMEYGIPQKRERIVIIGVRDGVEFSYPQKARTIKTLRDALLNVPPSEGQSYSPAKKAVLDLVPPGCCWRSLPLEIQKSYMGKSFDSGGGRTGMARRISWDEPCLTLTCSPSQKQTERCHPSETRPFTVREYARIQTFPDDWSFCGGIGEKYKQIGNAVPVKLAKQLGRELIRAIKQYRETNITKAL